MTIADQINRLNNAKAAIKQSLENKGVTVSDSALLDEYPALISSIPMEGGDPYYEEFYNLRTSNGTNMAGLFSYCPVPELDLRNLDVSNVTNMSDMFAYCKSSVNIDGWDTSKVTNTDEMFYQFFGTVDISNLDFSNVTSVKSMFYASNIDNIQGIGSIKNPQATNYTRMFSNVSGTLLDLSSWDVSHVTNMNSMFTSFSFKKIDLTGWVTTNVTDMSSIFSCYNSVLEELIIPDWDMTNVTKYTSFFNTSTAYTKNLKFIDLSRSNDITIAKIASLLPTRTATTSGTVLVPANTSQEVCDTLAAKYWTAQKPEAPEEPEEVNPREIIWRTTNTKLYDEDGARYFNGLYLECNGSQVPEENITVLETDDQGIMTCSYTSDSDITSVQFSDGYLLAEPGLVEVIQLDTSNVTNMNYMFMNCNNLIRIPDLDTSNVTDMTMMYYNCTSMTGYADPDKYWNHPNPNLGSMAMCFYGCTNLDNYDEIPEIPWIID